MDDSKNVAMSNLKLIQTSNSEDRITKLSKTVLCKRILGFPRNNSLI